MKTPTRLIAPLIIALSVVGLSLGGNAAIANADTGSLVSVVKIASDPYGAGQWEVTTTAPAVSIDVVAWGPAQDVCGPATVNPCDTTERFITSGDCVDVHLVWSLTTETSYGSDEYYVACADPAPAAVVAPEPEPVAVDPAPAVEEPAPVAVPEPAPVVEPEPVATVADPEAPAPEPVTPHCG